MIDFEKEATVKSFVPDIISAILIFSYAFFSSKLGIDTFLATLKFIIIVILVMQFGLALLTDHICYSGMSKRVKLFYSTKSTTIERTHLFEDLMQYPFYTALMTFIYFFLGMICVDLFLFYGQNQAPNIIALVSVEFLFGTFFASLSGYNFCYGIVSSISYDIIRQGIEKDYVMKKQFFGIKIGSQMILYIALPIIFTCIINCTVLAIGYYPFDGYFSGETAQMQSSRMLNTIILNIITQLIAMIYFYSNFIKKNKKMTEVLNKMNSSNLLKVNPIDTDISDEFAYNHFLTNQLISMFRSLLFQTAEFGKTISKNASDLMRISNETESTSIEQSTGIKEIVSTMENATNLSHNIENRINDVTEIAKLTVEKVTQGSELLQKSLDSIATVSESNAVTIQGIKNLSEKINSIWEVANIIDNISDQTKIIAFNAELEATNSTKESRNFRNVANEVRRLTNSTIDSTREIKNKINAIQESSEALIKASEESTRLIRQESELALRLGEKFSNINNSAKLNSTSSNEIKYLVEQQTKAFDQIVNTLQQISTSIQGFSQSTRTLIETSRNLQENVKQIESINIAGMEEEDGSNE
ncbi:MAG: methyl-accepting chemotaxis protein [Treponema sp.]|nr:methyl-accepting chemotaxis protein [Treponema sp.]